jgi:hypothetical protein
MASLCSGRARISTVFVPRALAPAVLSIALVSCGGGAGGNDKGTKVTIDHPAPGQTAAAPVTLKAALAGAEEVPGPGVKDGVGTFVIDISGPKGCYNLTATMGEKPTMAHIHQGAKGASGAPVVDLMPAFAAGESAFAAKSCVDLPGGVAARLIGDPAGFYVNVHSAGHPDGAMRGQLARL